MLVLTRKKSESIIIENDIEIIILEIKKNEVKIGIKAPRNKNVLRKEIHELILNENLKARMQNKATLKKLLNWLPKKD